MNFYETIGFLYSKKVIDGEIVWHFFSASLLPYFQAAFDRIVALEQNKDPNSFCELDRVYRAVQKIEASKHPSGDTLHLLRADAVQAFLKRESKLKSSTLPGTSPAR